MANFLRPLIITLWLGVFLVGSILGAQNSSAVAIVGAHLVRLDGSGVLRDSVVLIENERISAIGTASDVVIPAGARKIRLDDAWLAPGLMNMHVHWGLILPGKEAARLANETNAALALRMAKNARDSLLSGTTTVRMPGDRRHADIALMRAIERGEAVGPRLVSAGESVPITHGHGAKGRTGYDGPYELMKGVRKQIQAGATWIKIAISGGIATDGGGIAEALMTPEEIHAVIDAAHRFGVKVAAHSGSPSATSIAVKAGISSIEHGYHLTREVLREMKNAGTWYVPTIVVSQPATLPFFLKIGSPEWYLKRRDSTGEDHWKALEMAIEEGVNIALGTDQLPHEPNDGTVATVREAEYYVSAGMSSLQALRSATIKPAKMLGLDSDIGSLEVGKFADIIAVSGNPLEDIKSLRTIFFVMKGGAVVRNDLVEPL